MPFPKRPKRAKLPPRLTWKVIPQLSVHELEAEVQKLTDARYRVLNILPAGVIQVRYGEDQPAVTVVAYRNETRVENASLQPQQSETKSA